MKEWTLPVNEDLVAALADDFRSGPLLNDHGRRRLEEALVAELNGQRLSSDGVSNYTWDANGSNLTRNGTPGNFTFGYDPDSRLTGITGAATAIYTYDYQGRRSSKTVAGTTTTYLYDGLNLVGETAGGIPANYVFGPGIDEPLASYRAGQLSYLAADALGTISETNDPVGNSTLSTSFDAWGVARNETGTRYHPFTYTAREVGEAGLLFYRARLLQPGVGRFTQEDPMDFQDLGPRSYAYAGLDPILAADPLGLYTYKPGPNAPKPVGPGMGGAVTCIENCLGRPLVMTGGGECSGHNPGSKHCSGDAADFGFNSNPGIDKDGKRFFCCAARCGIGFGQTEFLGTRRAHYHIQIPGGTNGGHGEVPKPCTGDCN